MFSRRLLYKHFERTYLINLTCMRVLADKPEPIAFIHACPTDSLYYIFLRNTRVSQKMLEFLSYLVVTAKQLCLCTIITICQTPTINTVTSHSLYFSGTLGMTGLNLILFMKIKSMILTKIRDFFILRTVCLRKQSVSTKCISILSTKISKFDIFVTFTFRIHHLCIGHFFP